MKSLALAAILAVSAGVASAWQQEVVKPINIYKHTSWLLVCAENIPPNKKVIATVLDNNGETYSFTVKQTLPPLKTPANCYDFVGNADGHNDSDGFIQVDITIIDTDNTTISPVYGQTRYHGKPGYETVITVNNDTITNFLEPL